MTALVPEHRPGGPTGWPSPVSTTVGGHVTAIEFAVDGRSWRVALAGSGEPVYRARPTDGFAAVLDRTCGGHYAFRYLGFGGALKIRSHSVVMSSAMR